MTTVTTPAPETTVNGQTKMVAFGKVAVWTAGNTCRPDGLFKNVKARFSLADSLYTGFDSTITGPALVMPMSYLKLEDVHASMEQRELDIIAEGDIEGTINDVKRKWSVAERLAEFNRTYKTKEGVWNKFEYVFVSCHRRADAQLMSQLARRTAGQETGIFDKWPVTVKDYLDIANGNAKRAEYLRLRDVLGTNDMSKDNKDDIGDIGRISHGLQMIDTGFVQREGDLRKAMLDGWATAIWFTNDLDGQFPELDLVSKVLDPDNEEFVVKQNYHSQLRKLANGKFKESPEQPESGEKAYETVTADTVRQFFANPKASKPSKISDKNAIKAALSRCKDSGARKALQAVLDAKVGDEMSEINDDAKVRNTVDGLDNKFIPLLAAIRDLSDEGIAATLEFVQGITK